MWVCKVSKFPEKLIQINGVFRLEDAIIFVCTIIYTMYIYIYVFSLKLINVTKWTLVTKQELSQNSVDKGCYSVNRRYKKKIVPQRVLHSNYVLNKKKSNIV